jgi:glycosyltransferase involved in cell wall biosynthesis
MGRLGTLLFREFLEGRKIYQNGYENIQPIVSVVMPTFCRNTEGFLKRCIQSVLNQTFREFEFIIVDDGSQDGSQQVIERFASIDSRIVYVRHDTNSGLPAIRTNEAILLARAPYVAFIFDDNIWDPACLEKLMGSMSTNIADVHYAKTRTILDNAKQKTLGGIPLTREFLQHLNIIPNGSTLCTKAFFQKYGLYDPHLVARRICDWDLWLRSLILGATFIQLDDILSTEMGPSSPVSIGRSVQWDYKTIYSYMTDEKQFDERVRALRPENIGNYDVFNPMAISPYLRNYAEWSYIEEIIYKPFFLSHSSYSYTPLVNHNRLTDPNFQKPALSTYPICSVWSSRKRILLVRNTYDAILDDWKSALEKNDENIVLTCGEWQLGEFNSDDIDAVILLDCAAGFLKSFIQEFRNKQIPVGYLVYHNYKVEPTSTTKTIFKDYSQLEAVREVFGEGLFFPHPHCVMSQAQSEDAKKLMKLASTVMYYDERVMAEFVNVNSKMKVEWIFEDRDYEGIYRGDNVYVFCGDAPCREPKLLGQLRTIYEARGSANLIIITCPGESESAVRKTLPDATVTVTWERLFHLRNRFEKGLFVIADEMLQDYEIRDLSIIKEHYSRWGHDITTLNQYIVSPQTRLCLWDKEWEENNNILKIPFAQTPSEARRAYYLQTVCAALFLHASLLAINESPRCLVFINSSLLAGSEAYGLMVAKILHCLGIQTQVCIPSVNYLGKDGDPADVNAWLTSRGLEESMAMPYDTHYFGSRLFEIRSKGRIIDLSKKMEELKAGLVVCSGLMPEVAISAHINNTPLIHALFQPTGCELDVLTQFRDTTDGVISDSAWSAAWWREWLAPPVRVVPSHVEYQDFVLKNQGLPQRPIQIAIGGTVQPRKRQLEALLAIEPLVAMGHDLYINIYGYHLEIFDSYIVEMKRLIANSSLCDRVKFHGLVDMETIVSNNHMILSASIDESLPQTILYTMAAGLITVACPAGGISELVKNGQTGFLAKGFEVADVKEALECALSCQDKWKEIIYTARTFVAENYSELVAARRLVTALQSGVAMARSRGRDIARDLAIELDKAGRGSSNNTILSRIFVPPLLGNTYRPLIGPDITLAEIKYSFRCERNNLHGLKFLVGTYNTTPKGFIHISIRCVDTGKLVWCAVLDDLKEIKDNYWHEVVFPEIKSSAGCTFEFCLRGNLEYGRVALYEFHKEIPKQFIARYKRLAWWGKRALSRSITVKNLAVFPEYASELEKN